MSPSVPNCCQSTWENYTGFHNYVYDVVSDVPGFSNVNKWMGINEEDSTILKTVKTFASILGLFIVPAILLGVASILKNVYDWCVEDSEVSRVDEAAQNTLQNQLDSAQTSAANFQRELLAANAKCTLLNEQLEDADNARKSISEELDGARKVEDMLRKDLDGARETVQSLSGRLDTLEQENANLRLNQTNFESAKAQLQNRVGLLEGQLNAKEEQMAKVQEEVRDVQAALGANTGLVPDANADSIHHNDRAS